MKAPEFTGLQIARNPGIPIIYAGFILLVFGLALNFYLPPRRIWAAVKENTLYVGGWGASRGSSSQTLKRSSQLSLLSGT
jgi:cytochrome c biogenesis protein ResB